MVFHEDFAALQAAYRHVGETNMNVYSRSHSIYQMELEFKTLDRSEDAESIRSALMHSLRSTLMHVQEVLEGTKSQSISLRRDLEKADEDKSHVEQRMNKCIGRMGEAEHMTKIAKRDAKRTIKAAEKYCAEAAAEEREKLESQKMAAERMTAVERASALSMLQIQRMQGQIHNLQRQLFKVRDHETALEIQLVGGFTNTPPGKSPMAPTRIKGTFQDAGMSFDGEANLHRHLHLEFRGKEMLVKEGFLDEESPDKAQSREASGRDCDEESSNAEEAQLQQDYDEEKNLSVSVEDDSAKMIREKLMDENDKLLRKNKCLEMEVSACGRLLPDQSRFAAADSEWCLVTKPTTMSPVRYGIHGNQESATHQCPFNFNNTAAISLLWRYPLTQVKHAFGKI